MNSYPGVAVVCRLYNISFEMGELFTKDFLVLYYMISYFHVVNMYI